jgi:hypothetical protein
MDAILCTDARPLIPAWADGELSEAQAAPLRAHLLGCRDCRGSTQDLRALHLWFDAGVVDGSSLVPPGFAARVARRAFAGDRGERGATVAPAARLDLERERRRTLQFVLWSTAAAAMLVVALSVALRLRDLPSSERLRADNRTPQSTEEILEKLQELDAREAGLALPPSGRGQEGEAAPAAADKAAVDQTHGATRR